MINLVKKESKYLEQQIEKHIEKYKLSKDVFYVYRKSKLVTKKPSGDQIDFRQGEEWAEVFVAGIQTERSYLVSNFGRIASKGIGLADASLFGSKNGFVKAFSFMVNTIEVSVRTYRLVAECFLPNTNPLQTKLIHLNHDLKDNDVKNLKWVTPAEAFEHRAKDPGVIKNLKTKKGLKLTQIKVKKIKEMLFTADRKTRVKQVAKMFGISEMSVWRIQSGETWKEVTVYVEGFGEVSTMYETDSFWGGDKKDKMFERMLEHKELKKRKQLETAL